jgi:hypothetical protein
MKMVLCSGCKAVANEVATILSRRFGCDCVTYQDVLNAFNFTKKDISEIAVDIAHFIAKDYSSVQVVVVDIDVLIHQHAARILSDMFSFCNLVPNSAVIKTHGSITERTLQDEYAKVLSELATNTVIVDRENFFEAAEKVAKLLNIVP